MAFANGAIKPRPGVLEAMRDKASGLALVRFDKPNRRITFECWPFLADVSAPGSQFPGWPVTVGVLDNHERPGDLSLPRLQIQGPADPVVQVIDEEGGEVVYTLRIAGKSFRPHVFAPGRYSVKVGELAAGRFREFRGLVAKAGDDQTLEVEL